MFVCRREVVRAEGLRWFPHLAFPSAKYRQAAQLQQQRDAEGVREASRWCGRHEAEWVMGSVGDLVVSRLSAVWTIGLDRRRRTELNLTFESTAARTVQTLYSRRFLFSA